MDLSQGYGLDYAAEAGIWGSIFPLLSLCLLFFQIQSPFSSPFLYLGPGGDISPSTSSLTLPTQVVLGPQKSDLEKQSAEHSFEYLSVPLAPRPVLTTSELPDVAHPC